MKTLVLLGALMALGCGGTPLGTSTNAQVLCNDYIQAVCNKVDACFKTNPFGSHDGCISNLLPEANCANYTADICPNGTPDNIPQHQMCVTDLPSEPCSTFSNGEGLPPNDSINLHCQSCDANS